MQAHFSFENSEIPSFSLEVKDQEVTVDFTQKIDKLADLKELITFATNQFIAQPVSEELIHMIGGNISATLYKLVKWHILVTNSWDGGYVYSKDYLKRTHPILYDQIYGKPGTQLELF